MGARSSTARLRLCLELLVSGTLLACSGPITEADVDPLLGTWRSIETVEGHANEVAFDVYMRGDATIYLINGEHVVPLDYTAVGFVIDDQHYDVEMICEGGCRALDFTMDCVLDGSQLSCTGDGPFTNYERLDFQRSY